MLLPLPLLSVMPMRRWTCNEGLDVLAGLVIGAVLALVMIGYFIHREVMRR